MTWSEVKPAGLPAVGSLAIAQHTNSQRIYSLGRGGEPLRRLGARWGSLIFSSAFDGFSMQNATDNNRSFQMRRSINLFLRSASKAASDLIPN